jgi:urease accessory protein
MVARTERVLRAHSCDRSGAWHGEVYDRVILDFDARYRRRCAMETEGGLAFLLDLERATHLRSGDALVLEDGRRIAVIAAAEPLAKLRCENAEQLARLAWHLGNRHLALMVHGGRIYIRRDAVIETMVRGLGAIVEHVEAPFDPEGGAYHSDAHGHSHD